jgi:hypothetical protein
MSKQTLQKLLRIFRWAPIVLCLLYIVLVLVRIPVLADKEKTKEAAAHIRAEKITMGDVLGIDLPTMPDDIQDNSTLEGLDTNKNGIRDDVELELFKTRASIDTTRVRAAELQYAHILQSYLTDVFNKDTWEATSAQEDRAFQCLGQTFRRAGVKEDELFPLMEVRVAYLKGLVFNTQKRKDAYKRAMNFTTGFGLENRTVCDVDPDTLPH